MNRPIIGFYRDEESHWVARLSCGHSQHTRHIPPFSQRPWVLTERGRDSRIGEALDCLLCDRGEMPEEHEAYQRTKSFSEKTVPAALTANHTTKAGVWGLIHVEAGELEYSIEDARLPSDCQRIERLRPGDRGVVIAEVEHHVTPIGVVVFYVEFWRSRDA